MGYRPLKEQSNPTWTYRQIPFDPAWIDENGFMTGALSLIGDEDLDRDSGLVYIGYQLHEDDHGLKHSERTPGDHRQRRLRSILDHTVDSKWRHPLSFRISYGEIVQELTMAYPTPMAPGTHSLMNCRAQISRNVIYVHAVDRDWQRIESMTSLLAMWIPHVHINPAQRVEGQRWFDRPTGGYVPVSTFGWFRFTRVIMEQLFAVWDKLPGADAESEAIYREALEIFKPARRIKQRGSSYRHAPDQEAIELYKDLLAAQWEFTNRVNIQHKGPFTALAGAERLLDLSRRLAAARDRMDSIGAARGWPDGVLK